MNRKKILFNKEIFCNIINVFTVTFDKFNESLLNKGINVFVNHTHTIQYNHITLEVRKLILHFQTLNA